MSIKFGILSSSAKNLLMDFDENVERVCRNFLTFCNWSNSPQNCSNERGRLHMMSCYKKGGEESRRNKSRTMSLKVKKYFKYWSKIE